ncbi:AAA family ATPase [Candidatus Woesearchaeota archaeon]|nr:AAA family ATPase [Candidatus Woesearchaeota archaeon]
MNEEILLLGLGYNKLQAKILFILLHNNVLTVDEVVEKAEVTRSRVYQILKEFEIEGKVYSSNERPKKYSMSDTYVRELYSKIKSMSEAFISDIKPGKKTENIFLNKIKSFFKAEDYEISDFKYSDSRSPFVIDVKNFFNFIADRDVKIAVVVIDKSNEKHFTSVIDVGPIELILGEFFNISLAANCVAPFIIVDPSLPHNKKINNKLMEGLEEFKKLYILHQNKGFEDNYIFISTDSNVENNIKNVINSIRDRKRIANQLITNVSKLVDSIDKKIFDIERLVHSINIQLVEKVWIKGRKTHEKINKIKIPFRNIVEREKRNKDLVKQKYIFNFVRLSTLKENIAIRKYFPSISKINNYIDKFEETNKQLSPIAFELGKLKDSLFSYLFNKHKSINPFIFTIPEERDGYVENQEEVSLSFKNFCKEVILRETVPFKILKGPEGVGKTHILKYLLKLATEENKLFYLYTSCEVKQESFIYDLSKQIFDSLSQDKNLTKSITERYDYCHDTEDLMTLLLELQSQISKKGYKGIVLAIDEFENAIETPGSRDFQIDNLKKMIKKSIGNFGVIISCREDRYNLLIDKLDFVDSRNMTDSVKPLNIEHIKKLIEHRCKAWGAEKISISDDVLYKILEITNSNTRDIIKYLREVYWLSQEKSISLNDINKLQIPIFKREIKTNEAGDDKNVE